MAQLAADGQVVMPQPDIAMEWLPQLAAVASTFASVDLDLNPIAFSRHFLRFELGGDWANGSTERIMQAADRASAVFGAAFADSRTLLIIANDWSADQPFGGVPGSHLQSLLGPLAEQLGSRTLLTDNDAKYRQHWFEVSVADTDLTAMLTGIARRDQGIQPRVAESLYFVDTTAGIAADMYDDRGCLVYSDNMDVLTRMATLQPSWVIERR